MVAEPPCDHHASTVTTVVSLTSGSCWLEEASSLSWLLWTTCSCCLDALLSVWLTVRQEGRPGLKLKTDISTTGHSACWWGTSSSVSAPITTHCWWPGDLRQWPSSPQTLILIIMLVPNNHFNVKRLKTVQECSFLVNAINYPNWKSQRIFKWLLCPVQQNLM